MPVARWFIQGARLDGGEEGRGLDTGVKSRMALRGGLGCSAVLEYAVKYAARGYVLLLYVLRLYVMVS